MFDDDNEDDDDDAKPLAPAKYVSDILAAVDLLHFHGLCHYDISEANIMKKGKEGVSERTTYKLIDFGRLDVNINVGDIAKDTSNYDQFVNYRHEDKDLYISWLSQAQDLERYACCLVAATKDPKGVVTDIVEKFRKPDCLIRFNAFYTKVRQDVYSRLNNDV